jgi:hypothetical protein
VLLSRLRTVKTHRFSRTATALSPEGIVSCTGKTAELSDYINVNINASPKGGAFFSPNVFCAHGMNVDDDPHFEYFHLNTLLLKC